MNRRAVLRTAVVGLAGGAGCIGGGGEVVTTVQRSVSVQPGQGWIKEIPDVSDPGGAIQYRAKADRPFDVYFFSEEESYMFYDTYTDGGDPALTPAGNTDVSTTAEEVAEDTYEAATDDGGAREPIDASGPYFFVVDHSDYRDDAAPDDDEPSPLEVFVDLTVTERKLL
ncbi:hypothetical protein [Halosimplex salinum]|uniref:hypothetical protein n=1 Tax=Halosimplex salinum TaxID=1710538 RepID=UPI000F4A9B6C|nr:hypothetical protein [Halosimplex salinum]